MDILNWLYLRTNKLIRTTPNNAQTDLVALGADVTFARRGDKYLTYAMTLADLSNAGDAANTGYYTIDLNSMPFPIVDVTTPKGVIEIILKTGVPNPLPAFGSAVNITISNAAMDFSNPDNVYMQFSPYYSPDLFDSFIPYVVATGFISIGANYAIFNANPAAVGAIIAFTPGTGTTLLPEAGQTYTAVPANTGGSTFTVVRNGAGAISSVTLVNPGSGYLLGEAIGIDGSVIGGVTGVDDLIITVDNITYTNQFEGRFYLYYELYNF